mgnify:FL=1
MRLRQAAVAVAIALVVLASALVLAAPRARAQGGPTAVVVNFDVTVDLGATKMMERALATAEAYHAKAIVIVMNTPGGYLSDMVNIVDIIERAQQEGIEVLTYVPPDGMAASAGSYIAMASNSILMGNGSFIGPSTPIVVGGTPLEQNHTESAMLALMESLAARWGRNVTAAEDMVLYDIAYTAAQAYRIHLINGMADSLEQAMDEWGLANASTVTISENAYEQFLSAISNPTLDGILLTLGFLVILIDLYHPTLVLTAVGVVSIVLGLVGAEVVGASLIGLTLVIVGAVVMLLEIKMGHGLALMAGAALAAVGGYLMAMNIPYGASNVPSGPKYALIDSTLAVVGVAAGLYIRWVAAPLRRRKALTGPESLVGERGVAVTDLNPEGEGRVQGIIWRAESRGGPVKAGTRVVVVGRMGLKLIVVPETAEAKAP